MTEKKYRSKPLKKVAHFHPKWWLTLLRNRWLSLDQNNQLFAGLSVFVACLGLFGFSYLVVYQKVKEIGIRKILGASSISILKLLSSEFLLLILMASVLSIPLTYYLSSNWLSRYAYRIDIQWEHFTIPVLIVLSISIGTICLHLLKAIRSNPVDSLKNDN